MRLFILVVVVFCAGVLKVLGNTPFAFFGKTRDPLNTYPNKTGLVALWRMDQDPVQNGSQVADAMGVHHGTLFTNNGTDNKAVPGLLSNAASFDGSGDYVQVAGNAVFNRPANANVTIMGWVSRRGAWSRHCFVSIHWSEFSSNWCVGARSTTELLYWDSVGFAIDATVATIPLNVWNHFALTLENGSTARLYWNGVLIGSSGSANTTVRTNYNVWLAADNYGGYGNVDLDEVSYWNRTLTATEIDQIRQNQMGQSSQSFSYTTNFRVFNITQTGFDVSLRYSGDKNGNSSAVLHYCNQTDSPGCTPSAPGLTLTKSGLNFIGTVTGLSSPIDPGDYLNLRAVISDADGAPTSPVNTSLRMVPSTPKRIHRSVAAGVTAALATGNNASSGDELQILSGIATFESALAGDIGVGDILVYHPSDTLPGNTVAVISGRNSNTEFEVLTTAGGAVADTIELENWMICRAYTSLANAEAGAENTCIPVGVSNFDTGNRNTVTNNERWEFAMYGSGTADTTNVIWADWTMDIDRYVRIYSPHLSSEVGVSQRHQGVWDSSKYHLIGSGEYAVAALALLDSHIRVESIQVDNNSPTNLGSMIRIEGGSAQRIHISGNIIRSSSVVASSLHSAGVAASPAPAGSRIYIYNNIIYDTKNNGVDASSISANTQVYIMNNTIYNSDWRGIIAHAYTAGSRHYIYNNIVYNSGDKDYHTDGGGNLPVLQSNISSDTTLGQRTITFVDVAAKNFLIGVAETDTKDWGFDPTPPVESDFIFNTDILGFSRPNQAWDIGAHELP